MDITTFRPWPLHRRQKRAVTRWTVSWVELRPSLNAREKIEFQNFSLLYSRFLGDSVYSLVTIPPELAGFVITYSAVHFLEHLGVTFRSRIHSRRVSPAKHTASFLAFQYLKCKKIIHPWISFPFIRSFLHYTFNEPGDINCYRN